MASLLNIAVLLICVIQSGRLLLHLCATSDRSAIAGQTKVANHQTGSAAPNPLPTPAPLAD